jgi:hypothetical protein
VLPGALAQIDALPSEIRVLDVGGWANPLARADAVIDLMPYETRGLYGAPEPGAERFSEASWHVADICDRKLWPFSDNEFGFVVCGHTLEDVRDPVWVCSEMSRVGMAGYVEVPSRLEEQTFGIHGPWVGWSHHRWLVDLDSNGLTFVFKSHALQGNPDFSFPFGFTNALEPNDLVHSYFWEERLPATERVLLTAEEHDAYIRGPIEGYVPGRGGLTRRAVSRAEQLAERVMGRIRRSP